MTSPELSTLVCSNAACCERPTLSVLKVATKVPQLHDTVRTVGVHGDDNERQKRLKDASKTKDPVRTRSAN